LAGANLQATPPWYVFFIFSITKICLMKKALLFSVLIMSMCSHMHAQVRMWVNNYNGSSLDEEAGKAIIVDNAGNSYVAGYTQGAFSRAFSTLKYNTGGTEQWVATYDETTATDYANDIAIDGSGNIYVTGFVSDSSFNYGTIKYDSGGSDQWSVEFDGGSNGEDEAKAIVVDAPGNVYVTGQATGPSGDVDICTIKYNSAGVFQWARYYNGTADSTDTGVDIAMDGSGNIYVAGNTSSLSGGMDYVVIKYNSSGTQFWAAKFNGSGNGNEIVRAMAVDATGNVFLTGTAMGGYSVANYGTVKFNNAGLVEWSMEYNGTGGNYDAAYDVGLDDAGNVYVTGVSLSSVSGFYDYATLKYGTGGTQVWAKEFNGSGNADDQANGIAVDGSGNVFVTGWSDKPDGDPQKKDYLTVMYDTDGNVVWSDEYDGPSGDDDIANDIALDPDGNAYVTGMSSSIGVSFGTTTIKYCTAPEMPVISQSGTMLSSSASMGNQWYLNGTIIPGATSQNYTPTATGNYTVVVTNTNGCSTESAVFTVSSVDVQERFREGAMNVFPNPCVGKFSIYAGDTGEKYELGLLNMYGEKINAVYREKDGFIETDISGQPAGVYLVTVRWPKGVYKMKLMKE
jgi:uncharacterized delta-60 repeat protein